MRPPDCGRQSVGCSSRAVTSPPTPCLVLLLLNFGLTPESPQLTQSFSADALWQLFGHSAADGCGFFARKSCLQAAVLPLGPPCCVIQDFYQRERRKKKPNWRDSEARRVQSRPDWAAQSAVYNISPHSSPWQPGEILTAHRAVKLLPFVWGDLKPTCVGFPTAAPRRLFFPLAPPAPTQAGRRRQQSRLKCYATG